MFTKQRVEIDTNKKNNTFVFRKHPEYIRVNFDYPDAHSLISIKIGHVIA